MSFKFLFIPPQSDLTRKWADRLDDDVAAADVVAPETMEETKGEIVYSMLFLSR